MNNPQAIMDSRKRSVSSSATNVSFNHTRSSSISSATSEHSVQRSHSVSGAHLTDHINRSRASLDSINSADDEFNYWRQPSFYTHHNGSSSSTITGAAHSIANVGFNTLKKTASSSSSMFTKPMSSNPLTKLFSKNLSLEKLSHSPTNSVNGVNSNMGSSTSKKILLKLRKDRKRPELSIQTTFPTMLTESPLRKTSKELERIASIGTSDTTSSDKTKVPKTPKRLHHHLNPTSSNHHHFLRSNKNNNLSSSNSNSHITGDNGTIYNFHPTTPGLSLTDLSNIILQSEHESLYNLSLEDREQKADDAWSLLYSLVMPVFKGQLLKVPIEDLNKIVLLHLSLRIQEKVPSVNLIGEYLEFISNGLRTLENQLISYNKVNAKKDPSHKLVIIWEFFHNKVFYILEGILQPLQLEFEGRGISWRLTEFNDYWLNYFDSRQLNTKKMILTSFRDHIVIPYYDNQFYMNEKNGKQDEIVSDNLENNLILLQCFGILNSIQSGDTNQNVIERQFELVKQQIKQCQ